MVQALEGRPGACLCPLGNGQCCEGKLSIQTAPSSAEQQLLRPCPPSQPATAHRASEVVGAGRRSCSAWKLHRTFSGCPLPAQPTATCWVNEEAGAGRKYCSVWWLPFMGKPHGWAAASPVTPQVLLYPLLAATTCWAREVAGAGRRHFSAQWS